MQTIWADLLLVALNADRQVAVVDPFTQSYWRRCLHLTVRMKLLSLVMALGLRFI
jgi:hypothetical protein